MLPRPGFVLRLCLMMTMIAVSSGNPLNTSAKPAVAPKFQAGQGFVINNNCGLAHADREMMAYIKRGLAYIKAKVDYIAAHSYKGNLNLFLSSLAIFVL